MKKIITICFALCITCFGYAQRDLEETYDSQALISRTKADIVLSKLDTTLRMKILYSLQDRDYLIIFKKDNCYKEYVLKVDSVCNILAVKEIDNDEKIEKLESKKILSRSDRKLLNRLLEDKQTIKDAFDTNQYNTAFITSMPNATWVAGVPSYFVLKDEKNKRYGEYSMSSITTPCPINPNLWAYLLGELMNNTNKQ